MSRSDVLVDADWVEARIGDPGVVIVEVDEDTSAYDKGHIPSAIKIDWKKDLQDPVRRDFVDKTGFENLMSERGISNDDTVVLYGGNNTGSPPTPTGTSGSTGTTRHCCSTVAGRSGSSTRGSWRPTSRPARGPATPRPSRTRRSARCATRWWPPSASAT